MSTMRIWSLLFALVIALALLIGGDPVRAQNQDATGETSSDWTICMRLCYVAWAEANPPPFVKKRKSGTVSSGATYGASLLSLPTPTGDDGWRGNVSPSAWTNARGFANDPGRRRSLVGRPDTMMVG